MVRKTIAIKIKVEGSENEIRMFKEGIKTEIESLLENYDLGYEIL